VTYFWPQKFVIFHSHWFFVVLLILMLVSAPRAEANTNDFNSCLADLRIAAGKEGVADKTFRQATDGLSPDLRTVERMERQVEFTLTFTEYLARQVSAARIHTGRAKLAEHNELLADIEARYGVDPAIIVAIWGMESSYGAASGNYSVVQSLATLSCYGRRQPFFRNEFFSALRILEQGDVTMDDFIGSWAGAFGQTQFLPTSFERLAVDHSGDGRRDIIGNIADALASAANYLRQAGWKPAQTWGFAVRVPAAFTPPGSNWRERKPLSFWQEQGLKRADGSPLITADLSATAQAGLVATGNNSDPYFLVFANFDALHRYNPAVNYALAIGHLADYIRD
jgi:lytic murein transglycosylase